MSLGALRRVPGDVLFAGLGVVSILAGTQSPQQLQPVDVIFTAGWVTALLARRWCAWAPALVPLVIATHAALQQDWPNHTGVVTMLALLVSAGAFGLHVPHARAIAAGALWPAAIAVLMVVTPYGEEGLSDWFYPSLFALLVLGGGMIVGRATSARLLARERADAADREISERCARIAARERSRIAQDLRALVADGVRSMQQRAGRARRSLHAGDMHAAAQLLLEVEDRGRETLGDLRHMLGLLRRDMSDDGLRPQPGLDRLDGIIHDARERGVEMAVAVEGDAAPLPSGVEVVLYRVIERTVEHACSSGVRQLVLRICHEPDAVGVQLRAHGLGRLVAEDQLAIRERVVLYGGELVSGTDECDRGVLQVRLPLPAAAQGAGP